MVDNIVPIDITGAAATTTPILVDIANKYADKAAAMLQEPIMRNANTQIIKVAMYEFLQEYLSLEVQAYPRLTFDDHG